MPIHYFTDSHVHHQAILQLRNKGVEIIRCQDVGMKDDDDEDLLDYATQHDLVLITCDDDFERIHARWQEQGREHGGIVYFGMADQCKSVSIIVREIMLLFEAASYEEDLYNQIWRAKT